MMRERADRLLAECGEPSIADYAAIGNCKTLGLVSRQGSLDWLCMPHFSGASLFAALLDAERGGRFVLRADGVRASRRRYLPGSNVLETEHRCQGGVLRVLDLMVISEPERRMDPEHEVLRIAECIEGEVDVQSLYDPRPDYARSRATLVRRGRLGWQLDRGRLVAYLAGDLPFAPLDDQDASSTDGPLYGEKRLRQGERVALVLSMSHNEVAVLPDLGQGAHARLEATLRYWREYSGRCRYDGPWREAVVRSSLALKLLDNCLSGAMVAAGTTSLPESWEGGRNWDYRYCWLRDSGQVLQSFSELGYHEESDGFLEWLLHATRLTRPRLQPLYDVYGESELKEEELSHLRGHRGVGPVRIGNGAAEQLQLDVYGDVIIAACDFVRRGGRLDGHDQRLIADFGSVVLRHWQEPDSGIWEVRTAPRHHVHSKLMCWAACDRLLAIHDLQPLPIDTAKVHEQRELIRADIEVKGRHPERDAYVGYYGGRAGDAALLLIPRLGYLPPRHPRVIGTRRFLMETLERDGLLYRYPPGGEYDGLGGHENFFGICSFWMVEALVQQGEREEAERRFGRLVGLANDVGLYAEEFDTGTLEPMGNFPQAFTHVGLITAALALERAGQQAGEAA